MNVDIPQWAVPIQSDSPDLEAENRTLRERLARKDEILAKLANEENWQETYDEYNYLQWHGPSGHPATLARAGLNQ